MPGCEAAVPAGVLPHSTSNSLFFLSSELEQISILVLSSANTVTKGRRQLCSKSAVWVEANAVLLVQEGLVGSVVSLQHFRFWDVTCLNVCIHLGFRLELKLVLRTLMIDDCSTEVVLLLLLGSWAERKCEAYTLDKDWRNDPAPCGVFQNCCCRYRRGKNPAEGTNRACQSLPYICLL